MAQKLLPFEKEITTVHRHWIVLVYDLTIPALIVAVTAVIDIMAQAGHDPSQPMMVLAAAVGAVSLWVIGSRLNRRAVAARAAQRKKAEPDFAVYFFLVIVLVEVLTWRGGTTSLLVLASLAVGAVVGLWVIWGWVEWTSKSFTLTNQRVILHEGVVTKSSRVIPLDRIQDIVTRQSVLGQMLNFGVVDIDATGTKERMDHMPSPNRFRDDVFIQMRGGPPKPAATETSDEDSEVKSKEGSKKAS